MAIASPMLPFTAYILAGLRLAVPQWRFTPRALMITDLPLEFIRRYGQAYAARRASPAPPLANYRAAISPLCCLKGLA